MNNILLFFILVLNIVTNACQDKEIIFVLAYTWTAGFCYGETYPGCLDPQKYWKYNFTIHGLWPQYIDNGYPSYCTNEQFDPTIPENIGMDIMTQYWENVKSEITDDDYDSFWEHEWDKHGTCSGLTQYQYFNNTINLIQYFGTPTIVTENVGNNISIENIRDSFGGQSYVSLQCTDMMLMGAYTCWDTYNYIQIKCPDEVIKEDSCIYSNDALIVEM
jgi:ribonuclease T2